MSPSTRRKIFGRTKTFSSDFDINSDDNDWEKTKSNSKIETKKKVSDSESDITYDINSDAETYISTEDEHGVFKGRNLYPRVLVKTKFKAQKDTKQSGRTIVICFGCYSNSNTHVYCC